MEQTFHKQAFILLAHKQKEYLAQIKDEIMKREQILAVDLEDFNPIYFFIPCHISMYSIRLPQIHPVYPYAVLFKCPNAATLIADIMEEVSDIIANSREEGIICIIPENFITQLQEAYVPTKLKKLNNLLDENNILFENEINDKWDLLDKIVQIADENHLLNDAQVFRHSLIKRERIQSTGIGDGLAFPHVRCDSVIKPFMIIIIHKQGLPFDALDNDKVRLIISLGFSKSCDSYLPILSELNRILMSEKNRQDLLACTTPSDVIRFFQKEF
ncbi:MAG: PTS sugar transporter subunit IIA [Planctomycetes bacterium]|jgi:mannitol/fructose-specific phosphotransferase system IIA component (Ntr-type)|nr:PTS sugar transporter subunit IIA [Planctomycetota bacterium]HPY73817.1 PTS sugar transporter subunit IIA [Planctomycetota bacterium]HPY73825.1 PTS sugar transporter subunit IIA [Planctomycetota bacterium]HQA99473.1 PTS sugar transporter subunit IIA [Planctomycetota bacterium]HQA99481.1 PTS sugar transporter subunit IIA [Planctomycetota bacterium]